MAEEGPQNREQLEPCQEGLVEEVCSLGLEEELAARRPEEEWLRWAQEAQEERAQGVAVSQRCREGEVGQLEC